MPGAQGEDVPGVIYQNSAGLYVAYRFTPDGLEAMADIAYQVNQSTQNIGARRLHTIMERLLEEISFEAPYAGKKTVTLDGDFVRAKLDSVTKDEDLSRFIL